MPTNGLINQQTKHTRHARTIRQRSRRTNRPNRRPVGVSRTVNLKVAYGNDIGRQLQCRADQPTVLGRHSRSDLRLIDARVSRWHAAITFESLGKWIITDLESENGTHVNGIRITAPQPLADNDLIRVGSTLINVCF